MIVITNYHFELEVLASLLGLAYVILMARHNIWAWLASAVGAAIYGLLLWQDQLPMQAVLHSSYIVLAGLGWYQWKQINNEHHSSIERMSLDEHLVVIGFGLALTLLFAYLLATKRLSQSPLLDSATTVFALMITWMVVKQRLENWLYWVVIDLTTAVLFWQTNHLPMAFLYIVYTGIALYGYGYWHQLYLKQKTQAKPSTRLH
jgi:nicotinamide mononucleotide transporter